MSALPFSPLTTDTLRERYDDLLDDLGITMLTVIDRAEADPNILDWALRQSGARAVEYREVMAALKMRRTS